MKIIFLGTPSFGLPALRQIYQKHDLIACVCQPDRIGSRGKMEYSPVKEFALEHKIPLYQFEKVSRDGVEILKELAPDIMITAAYGQILSQEIIDIAPHGIINIHGSLLPELRGAAPIQYAILKGYKTTGITILQTVKEVDAGDMILQRSLEIEPYENCGHLFERLSDLGADAVIDALDLIEQGKAIFVKQDNDKATFSHKITAEQEKIDWSQNAESIINLVRALSPTIGAWTTLNNKHLKIFDMRLCESSYDGQIGQVVECGKKSLCVMCGAGKSVSIKVLQEENRKRMDISSFLCGNKISTGTVLGE